MKVAGALHGLLVLEEHLSRQCLVLDRAAERMQTVTSTGWKQAQQGLKGLAGGPLQVNRSRYAHRHPWIIISFGTAQN